MTTPQARLIARRPALAFGVLLTISLLPAALVLTNHSTASEVMGKTRPLTADPQMQTTKTVAEMERVAASDPSAGNRLNLSQALLHDGFNGRAILILNALIAEDPKNALAWNNLCVAHTQLQEYKQAIAACEMGTELDPHSALIQNNLKWSQGERDKVVAAETAMDAVPQSQRNAAYYLSRGLNLLHLGQYEQAKTAWMHTLSLDPHSTQAENNLGVAAMMQLRYAEAEADFRKAISFDADNQLAKNNLAWALAEEKNGR